MRVPALLLALLTASFAGASGCAGPPAPLQDASGPGKPAATPTGPVRLSGGGEFAAAKTPGETSPGSSPDASEGAPSANAAVVYDRKLVPQGAQASLTAESTDGKTRTSLVVEGLLPDRRYGAHLHTKPCGPKPDDSGPHYQHHPGQIDPASEVWLDFMTDGEGSGRSTARNDWALDPADLPSSLVLHSQATKTAGPKVGTAGDRVACLTLKKVP
ncbi:superoxide dismutase family protein [Nonomuraea zeae]|uniref:Superoxide dismutase family protein n=1 Tax=Nonomuraea zeae TaxID=1642303 RepID=A0A5S4GYU6_9ACTN|nr:superoxide dismutase family protein [Nonomuraea zeae]TMR31680.1 superoxide dismutase family protein [Nonomuraea zeae]